MSKKIFAIVLAGGKGTRMKSKSAKVVHEVNGIPMVCKIDNTLDELQVERKIYVFGYQMNQVLDIMLNRNFEFVEQREQLGTAHAVLQARSELQDEEGTILILCGDTPLLKAQDLQNFVEHHQASGRMATVLTTKVPNPFGYGRVIKDSTNTVLRIVEEKEATEKEKSIQEINTGVYCFESQALWKYLLQVDNDNNKGEYYFTDMIEILKEDDQEVGVCFTENFEDTLGINTKEQLSTASEILRKRKINFLLEEGVEIVDATCTYIEEEVVVETGCKLHPNVYIQGKSHIMSGTEIFGSTRIVDCLIGVDCLIEMSNLKESVVGQNCKIGPNAHLRPQSDIGDNCKIGNFVEIKNSKIESSVNISHMSYIGDCQIGTGTNIGAGTFTCNFDGVKKHKTIIGQNVFVGSNVKFVAPVEVKDRAVLAAGSVITDNVPEGSLAIARERQTNKENWAEMKWHNRK